MTMTVAATVMMTMTMAMTTERSVRERPGDSAETQRPSEGNVAPGVRPHEGRGPGR